MNEPSAEKIAELKSKFPRSRIASSSSSTVAIRPHVVVMTGPNRDEYKKFVGDIQRASEAKPADKLDAIRFAIEQNAIGADPLA
jgi:hypothetical protein